VEKNLKAKNPAAKNKTRKNNIAIFFLLIILFYQKSRENHFKETF